MNNTLRALDAALAEGLGWVWYRRGTFGRLLPPDAATWALELGLEVGRPVSDGIATLAHDTSGVPSYSSDLNRMAEVEAQLRERGQIIRYIESLVGFVTGEQAILCGSAIEVDAYRPLPNGMDSDGHAVAWAIATATAEQRCRAALQALGIRVEV